MVDTSLETGIGFEFDLTVTGKQFSVNRSYKTGNGRFYKNPDAVSWQDTIAAKAKILMRNNRQKVTDKSVAVGIDFFFESPLSDIDGPIKNVLDALQGIVYLNDKQIDTLMVFKHRANHRCAKTRVWVVETETVGSAVPRQGTDSERKRPVLRIG